MKKRIFGLDIIRAVAILLVLFSHLSIFGLWEGSYFMYLSGFYGVEIFFVLSGFLIGQILIREFNASSSMKTLRKFWVNRWMRTLPLYYVVLIPHAIWSFKSMPYSHFGFLQNANLFASDHESTFGESWSLAVEEWSYLILPLLILLVFYVMKNVKRSVFIVILIIVLFSLAERLALIITNPVVDYDSIIRKGTFLRIDAIAVGVLFAWIKVYYNAIFEKLSKTLVPIIALVVLFAFLKMDNILVYNFEGIKTIPSIIGIVLNTFLLGLLLPAFDLNSGINSTQKFKLLSTPISKIAKYSYCFYLIHLPIYRLYMGGDLDLNWWILVAISLGTIYFLGWISNVFIENPFIRLRDKINRSKS